MSSADTIVVKLVQGIAVDLGSVIPLVEEPATSAWSALLEAFPFVSLSPLAPDVSVTELQQLTAEARAADPSADIADLDLFFAIRMSDEFGLPDQVVDVLVEQLLALPFVEWAGPATDLEHGNLVRPFQYYLNDADTGLRVESLRFHAGGTGAGVRVVVVDDLDFDRSHPDLLRPDGSSKVDALTPQPSLSVTAGINHSTATLGIIGAEDNAVAVLGIARGATLMYAGTRRPVEVSAQSGLQPGDSTDLFEAMVRAAVAVRAGDIVSCSITIRAAPMFDTGTGSGIQISGRGRVPLDNDFPLASLLRLMRARGVIVFIAAGNGVHKGFLNPPVDDALDLDAHPEVVVHHSGAVVVGGLEPVFGLPPLTPPLSLRRWRFTTFGNRVTCCGWADAVMVASDTSTTTGFQIVSGTSFATPMVAGGVACLQGISLSRHGTTLTPDQVTALLTRSDLNRDWAPGGKVGLFPQFDSLAAQI